MKVHEIISYSFDELSEKAKETAIENKIEQLRDNCFLMDEFTDYCEYKAKEKGFNDAKLRYSLSYSQGDGLSFSANINEDYFFKAFNVKTSVADAIYNNFTFECNGNTGRYTYASKGDIDIYLSSFVSKDYPNLEDYVNKFKEFIQDEYMSLCEELYNEGYKYIEHESSEERALEEIKDMDEDYNEDGTLFKY